MAATLEQILLAPDTQPKVIADCYKLIEQELSEKQGSPGPRSSSLQDGDQPRPGLFSITP